jgi:hypothetical protein
MRPATALPPLSEVIWSVSLINQKLEVASSISYPRVTSKMFDKQAVRELTDFERIKEPGISRPSWVAGEPQRGLLQGRNR